MSAEGTPQGGPLSPLLSNILLDDLESELERRRLSFCRYADGCNICAASGVPAQGVGRAGERAMQVVAAFVEEVSKLKIDASKSAVARPWERKFLGYSVTWHKKPKIAEASRRRLAEKVRATLRKARGQSLQRAIERLDTALRGWAACFRLTQVKGAPDDLDGWNRRKLWTVLWRQWKLVCARAKNPMRAGIDAGAAVNHQRARPVVERRRFAHERRRSAVLIRPHGLGFVAGNSATPCRCLMNRRMPNGASRGMGGRRERSRLLHDP